MPTSSTSSIRDPVPPDGTGPVIEAVTAAATAGDLRGRLEVVVAFTTVVLRRETPTANLAMSGDEDRLGSWVAALLDAFVFVDTRLSGTIAARVMDAEALALDGDRPRGTVIELNCDDRDFIATSLASELHRLGHRVSRMVRVSFGRRRDHAGHLLRVGPARGAVEAEAFLEIELERHLDPARAELVVHALRRVLGDVFRVTDDHARMRALVEEAAARTRVHAVSRFPEDEVAESVALTEWLLDGHCVLLGTCRFPVVDGAVGPAEDDTCLGLLREPDTPMRRAPDRVAEGLLLASRLAEISTVHRQVPLQRFDLALVDDDGVVDGIGRLVCVFTQRAEASPVASIPLLRWKLQRLLELEDAVEGSYDEHAVTALFQALPKDDLFCLGVPDLHRTVRRLLAENRDQRVKVLMRAEPGTSAVSVLITMPSELYTRALRERLVSFLRAQLDGERVEVELSMGASFDTVARFLVHVAPDAPVPDGLDAVAREVQLLCRTWEQGLVSALGSAVGERASRLAATWADRLPPSYRDAVDPPDAVADVIDLEALRPSEDRDLRVRLTAWPGHRAGSARITLAGSGTVELSQVLPILESLGLWVVDELHWEVGGAHLHRLNVEDRVARVLDVEHDGERLADAILALWHDRADIDSLNRLVLRAGLTWREVVILRAYRRYRRQVDPRYPDGYLNDVMVAHPHISRQMLELFHARFASGGADRDMVATLTAQVYEACDRVERLDHDRMLRGIAATVAATLRTNLHLRPEGPLALKLNPAEIPDMPTPLPYREIFVHGRSVEGVHLRAGPVARGGLRLSDRPEDYRAEVRDLVRTQVLKNALIVPTGAKGGFVVKHLGEEDRPAATRAAYKAFITGLLDVTDNLEGDRVEPVPGRWDGDDPYLVVAADKGTAAFSDVANELAIERGFWLGDAFASGGSVGYDHKALGITARGAWVAVTRHFRELDVDVATEEFTAVGIGDMSGDVFGNAMLLSDRIRLVAAFDHRHVFLDPDPDPDASFVERRRLFEQPGSSWQDYDRALISAGGGVHQRSRKRIELTRQVRDVLRVSDAHLTPAGLIQAILRAPVDLLYLGGIGTYVRASSEPDQIIDDRANAEVRVSADALRCRVVGEGANLGFTQRARIEYARRGGRVNMDAIDNSAGVDTSDREVNVKILLGLALDDGAIDLAERNTLLAAAVDHVVLAVLGDCADQSDALTRARAGSAEDLASFEATQHDLVAAGVVDREVEALPDDEEYGARRRAQAGLTRPELAVLLAGAKRRVKAAVLDSDLPDEPAARQALVAYFPGDLAQRFDHLLDRHRLRRELVASEIANDLIDHLGPTVTMRLGNETGASPAEVAGAYWVARGVADGPVLWHLLSRHSGRPTGPADAVADPVDPGRIVADLLGDLTRRELLDHRSRAAGAGTRRAPVDLGARIAEDRPVLAELRAALLQMDRPGYQRARTVLAERLVAGGLDPAVAIEVAVLSELHFTPDIAALSRETGRSARTVTPVFLDLSDRLGVDRLSAWVGAIIPSDPWARAARQGLLDDLAGLRREATSLALLDAAAGDDPTTAVEAWLALRAVPLGEAAEIRRRLASDGDGRTSLDALTVAVRALRQAVV